MDSFPVITPLPAKLSFWISVPKILFLSTPPPKVGCDVNWIWKADYFVINDFWNQNRCIFISFKPFGGMACTECGPNEIILGSYSGSHCRGLGEVSMCL
jgi:hypothetical protein